jgi:hypothetical protein
MTKVITAIYDLLGLIEFELDEYEENYFIF